jgi:IS5 family transposase
MRKRFDPQLELGQTPIERVALPLKSRDELPPILAGLQWIFKTPEINTAVFALLEESILGDKQATGRPGMDLWHILVLGVARLGLDCDYDRLEYLANYDGLLRQIMGLPALGCPEDSFHHKTISENICHIDAELLEKINAIIVEHGLPELKKTRPKTSRLNSTATCWKPTPTTPPTSICCGTPGASASRLFPGSTKKSGSVAGAKKGTGKGS